MHLSDYLTILAVLLGPILAVQVQKLVERAREARNSKLWVFHSLMATRASRTSPRHVEALNQIDLLFHKDKDVVAQWRVYHDHLNTQNIADDQLAAWMSKGEDLFVDLLLTMSKSLGYKFDRVQIRRGVYAPRAQSEQELEFQALRKYLVSLASNTAVVPVHVVGGDGTDAGKSTQVSKGRKSG